MQDIKKQNIKIEIKNMNLYYGDFHALKDVELALPEKQITGVYRTFWMQESLHC